MKQMPLPSPSGHSFAQVPRAEIQRSQFDRSHGYKTTFDASYLIPIFMDEALPGDTFNVRGTIFARMATPWKPLMDNMRLETFFFAVPYRLVWANFVKMMGEQASPGDTTDYLVPIFNPFTPAAGSLSDYMGLPTATTADLTGVVSLFHRAYNRVWAEWFRDENLQNTIQLGVGDGPDTITNFTLRRRGKRHDYFTSCLPWPQKGAEVTLPLGTRARVATDQDPVGGFGLTVWGTDGTDAYKEVDADNAIPTRLSMSTTPGLEVNSLYADLANATAASINTLRQAFQVQKLLERDARGGTRYIETIKSHFGVTSPDARLQRPEYLGGGRSNVVIAPVAQTAPSPATPLANDAQGNLAAVGTASGSGHGFVKSFTEHTIVLGLACVTADLTYQEGLDRMFSRRQKLEFYWPALAHIGEQAVLMKEINARGTANDEVVFGYQERYGEYRYKPSRITGLFRSNAAGTLDVWHLSHAFTQAGTGPLLADAFIQDSAFTTVDRVIQLPSQPQFLLDAWFSFKAARPMPMFGVPGLIDHF